MNGQATVCAETSARAIHRSHSEHAGFGTAGASAIRCGTPPLPAPTEGREGSAIPFGAGAIHTDTSIPEVPATYHHATARGNCILSTDQASITQSDSVVPATVSADDAHGAGAHVPAAAIHSNAACASADYTGDGSAPSGVAEDAARLLHAVRVPGCGGSDCSAVHCRVDDTAQSTATQGAPVCTAEHHPRAVPSADRRSAGGAILAADVDGATGYSTEAGHDPSAGSAAGNAAYPATSAEASRGGWWVYRSELGPSVVAHEAPTGEIILRQNYGFPTEGMGVDACVVEP